MAELAVYAAEPEGARSEKACTSTDTAVITSGDAAYGEVKSFGEVPVWGSDAAQECRGRNVQSCGQGDDVVQADIALTPFDARNVRTVQVGRMGQLLLREPRLFSECADLCTKGVSMRWDGLLGTTCSHDEVAPQIHSDDEATEV